MPTCKLKVSEVHFNLSGERLDIQETSRT